MEARGIDRRCITRSGIVLGKQFWMGISYVTHELDKFLADWTGLSESRMYLNQVTDQVWIKFINHLLEVFYFILFIW